MNRAASKKTEKISMEVCCVFVNILGAVDIHRETITELTR